MDLERAIGIVREYAGILEENPVRNIQGRLMSLLPYDKETIKEAIKVELMYVGTEEPRDEKMFRTLQLGFLQLASFLPDSKVIPLFDVDEALDSNDVRHDYCRYLSECEKVNKQILGQTLELLDELDHFCQDGGI